MDAFEKIIGYSDIKEELIRIADALKNSEIYHALGASSPRGLLLHGVPGVGKSLMAQCLIEASGRRFFVCRKTEPDGEFVKTIKNTFDQATENAPSIVFLDDMDKFANSDDYHRDAEEYVTVQSCIDEIKAKEVFVLATVNDRRKLPASLIRAGRFDRVIKVDTPKGKDAEEIIRHYLSEKNLADDLDYKTVADILSGRSCAVLETVVNTAGLIAGFQRAKSVTAEHMMEACLRTVFNIPRQTFVPIDLERADSDAQVVWHEAGHAAVSELLSPGSVSLLLARPNNEGHGGVMKIRSDEENRSVIPWDREILVFLAGRAATELKYGILDPGASKDLGEAFGIVENLVGNLCFSGFDLHESEDRRSSEALTVRQEAAVAAEIERNYRRVKEMLCNNRSFLEAIAEALAQKGVLSAADIRQIRERCAVTELAG